MKEFIWSAISVIVFLIIVTFMFMGIANSKEIDFSVTGSLAYNHGSLGSGLFPAPGTKKDNWWGFSGSGQIKYSRWKLQPIFEVSYRKEKYDFSDWQAPVQKCEPSYLSFRGGAGYDFSPYPYFYLLIGGSFINYHVSIIERYPPLYHGRDIGFRETLLNFKVGTYRLWGVGPIKMGPELAMEIYPNGLGWHRCRTFKVNPISPMLGLRVQY